jgi:hypothetical protein
MFKPTWIVIGLLAIACVAEGVALWRLENRLTELEVTAPPGSSARRSASRGATTDSVDRAAVESIRTIDERVTVLEKIGVSTAPVATAVADKATSNVPEKAFDRRLEELVDRKIDERMKEGQGQSGDGKKQSIGELSKAVAMTPEQEDASVLAIDEGKKLSFELLSLPRADGKSMADDLITALKDTEDPAKVWGGFIQRLMTERVPGKNETYLSGILKIQKSTWDRLSRTLDEEQQTKLKRMGVDILEVKTGYEPFEELLSER